MATCGQFNFCTSIQNDSIRNLYKYQSDNLAMVYGSKEVTSRLFL